LVSQEVKKQTNKQTNKQASKIHKQANTQTNKQTINRQTNSAFFQINPKKKRYFKASIALKHISKQNILTHISKQAFLPLLPMNNSIFV
jgi:hypothetical protein